MERQFSESEPELMDLPNQDEAVLRSDLETIGKLNRRFGARKQLERIFRQLAGTAKRVTLLDLASGYGDHGRNLIERGRERGQQVTVLALDHQLPTLQIARQATTPDQKVFFIQADARKLPFRDRGAELVFCTLALHHFSDADASSVLGEMARVAKRGAACVDLARSRLGTFGIDLLSAFILRDQMARHDARLSIRRAFSVAEMRAMALAAGWQQLRQSKFLWFQQAIVARFER